MMEEQMKFLREQKEAEEKELRIMVCPLLLHKLIRETIFLNVTFILRCNIGVLLELLRSCSIFLLNLIIS